MRNNEQIEFVSTDVMEITEDIAAMYTAITGRTATAGPDRLFIQWVASAILLGNININYAANQNLASRAEGENLDRLGEDVYGYSRPDATYAGVQMKFTISEALEDDVIVPAGTRVTTDTGQIVFATDNDLVIQAGETEGSVHATCETSGSAGNGIAIGNISTCVNVFPYYESCENTDVSGGGSDVPDDHTYYEMMVSRQDGFTCAGPKASYAFYAKSVSSDIADVIVNSPAAGEVYIYALMNDGTKAGTEIKSLIEEACSSDDVRPLTDHVVVADPREVTFIVNVTYYMTRGSSMSASAAEAAVSAAVDEYVAWQTTKLGRDLNPDKLRQFIMETGVKRVIIHNPAYTVLSDGSAPAGSPTLYFAPMIAKCTGITITNGGYEDE